MSADVIRGLEDEVSELMEDVKKLKASRVAASGSLHLALESECVDTAILNIKYAIEQLESDDA